MKVITITNLKGGVAKTTTAINLAQRLANDGYKVLQLDLDHQANMSRFYEVQSESNVHALFTKSTYTTIAPTQINERLWLIPSDIHTATINLELTRNLSWPTALRRVLKSECYDSFFDYCVIDCPPALDMIVMNALTSADYVIIPLTTGQFAYDGLQSIMERIDETRAEINPHVKILGILLCMVSDRTRAAKAISDHLKAEGLDINTCKSRIRLCEAFKQAELNHQSIFTYDSKSNGAADMEDFYQEILLTIK